MQVMITPLVLITIIEVLENKLSSTEHAQCQHPNQVAMETLEQERSQLREQLEQQIQENNQLIK